jgi:hypothetical protein
MNPRSSIVTLFLLAAMPLSAVAQSQREVKDKSEVNPPSIRSVLSSSHTNADAVISQLVDVKPEIPSCLSFRKPCARAKSAAKKQSIWLRRNISYR